MRDLDSYRRDIKDALLTPRHFPDPAGQFRACPRPTHKGLGGIGKTPLAIDYAWRQGGVITRMRALRRIQKAR
jgi:hypothetical protein